MFGYKQIIGCFFIVVVAGCLLAGCPPKTGPAAAFTATPETGPAGLTVQFTDRSLPGSDPITAWFWNFGDGQTSTVQNPAHTYPTPGVYNVTLTVTTGAGTHTSAATAITVTGGEGEEEGEGAAEGEETFLLPGDVELTMVWCPPGNFMMGRYAGEQNSNANEDPRHAVTFAQGFWMGKYEVTKAQWQAVMNTTPWTDGFGSVLNDPNSPAVYVGWNDTQAFLAALNTHTGKTFRLPSEAQWEYACRAGTTTRFYWGDDLNFELFTQYVWVPPDYTQRYANIVGLKLPNPWGLYDMSGNAAEWCQDWFHTSYAGAPVDGSAWEVNDNDHRVKRGGGWDEAANAFRSAARGAAYSSGADRATGFRLVR